MKKLLAVLISITLHLFLLYFLLTTNYMLPVEEKKDSLKIVIKKKESAKGGVKDKSTKKIEEIGVSNFKQSLDRPDTNKYISTSDIAPDININETLFNNVVNVNIDSNIKSFEKSLENLMPDVTEEFVIDYKDLVSFSWHKDSRSLLSSINIDFDSFPETAFTGIGINIDFKVSDRGDVYDVHIKPPGSGSIDFDILMVEYITSLKFEPGESSSSGEIKIVYE